MIRLTNEDSLLQLLRTDIKECGKKNIVFSAGHFPLMYDRKQGVAVEAVNHWGKFSKYSLELACKIAQYSKNIGKSIDLANIL